MTTKNGGIERLALDPDYKGNFIPPLTWGVVAKTCVLLGRYDVNVILDLLKKPDNAEEPYDYDWGAPSMRPSELLAELDKVKKNLIPKYKFFRLLKQLERYLILDKIEFSDGSGTSYCISSYGAKLLYNLEGLLKNIKWEFDDMEEVNGEYLWKGRPKK